MLIQIRIFADPDSLLKCTIGIQTFFQVCKKMNNKKINTQYHTFQFKFHNRSIKQFTFLGWLIAELSRSALSRS